MRLDFFVIKLDCERSTGILSVGIKYSMRDIICDVINYRAPSFVVWKIGIKKYLKKQNKLQSKKFLYEFNTTY